MAVVGNVAFHPKRKRAHFCHKKADLTGSALSWGLLRASVHHLGLPFEQVFELRQPGFG